MEHATSDLPNRLALVTGASSGIGEAFARRLAADGWALVIVARRAQRLSALARELGEVHGAAVTTVTADLTRRDGLETAHEALADRIPDLAVLNAGFGSTGAFAEQDAKREADMVRLNCVAVTDLAGRLVPGMLERGSGDLIVISSAAAFQPVPFMATYAATKAFELHFVRALAAELRGTPVRALAVCPGPTRTEFGAAMGGSGLDPRVPQSSALDVVERSLAGVARGRTMVAEGPVAALASAARVVPSALKATVIGRVHRALRR